MRKISFWWEIFSLSGSLLEFVKKDKNVRILSAIRSFTYSRKWKNGKLGQLYVIYCCRYTICFLTTIRIYNDSSGKRTFERQIIQDFNIYDNAVEMKKSVFEVTESFFEEDVTVDDEDIGYVGKSNNKRLIKTDQHVDDAYTSRFNHKHSELVIYTEEKKRTRQGQKRKLSTTRNGTWIIFIYFNCCCLMSLLLLS